MAAPTYENASMRRSALKWLSPALTAPPGVAIAIIYSVATTFAVACLAGARAETLDIRSNRRDFERADFTNEEIKDGLFKIAFRAELQVGPPAQRIRKFDEPVRIFLVNKALPDRRGEIADIVSDISGRIHHLDLKITSNRETANFVVMLVRSHDVANIIRTRYGNTQAKRIQRSLNPQCLSGIAKDRLYRIRKAEVILPVDVGDFRFRDCAYEELLQALGAINDDSSVPWTMFNDDVQMGFFDVYDQYLLNILYDPRIRAGMSKEEVNSRFFEVLLSVRAWVTKAMPHDTNQGAASSTPPGRSNEPIRPRTPLDKLPE
jgi:Protein of unknown function (DUF2927)